MKMTTVLTIADLAGDLLAGKPVFIGPEWRSHSGDNWTSHVMCEDGEYVLYERLCTSDTCQCWTHEPWKTMRLTPEKAYALLRDEVQRRYDEAAPAKDDPVAAAALEA